MKLYKQIKSVLPNGLKYPFWYVFKAPQRVLSRFSIYYDLKGIGIYLWCRILPFTSLRPVTICTGIYNRSDNYIHQLLASINKADHKELIELSVFDCGSTDVPDLKNEIMQKWKHKLCFQKEEIPFTRSYTFNMAVKQASSEVIFICDADMSLPADIVKRCNQYVSKKRVWYPIFFFLYKDRPAVISKENGAWEQYGSKGMLACRKSDFLSVGGLNEQYKIWGDEDTELWQRFHKAGYTIIRNRQKNLFHHWHNSHNPKYRYMNEQHG